MQDDVHRLGAVAVWGVGLLQDIVLIATVSEVEVSAIFELELGSAIFIRSQRNQRVFSINRRNMERLSLLIAVCIETLDAVPVFISHCRVEFELYIPQRLTILVHLLNPLVEQRLEVEAQGDAGVVVAPLQVEHFQGVGGVAGVSITGPLHLIRLAGDLIQLFQRGMIHHMLRSCRIIRDPMGRKRAADVDIAGGKINRTIELTVDTAQVQDQHAVDKDPNVVISGELEAHVLLALAGIDHTVGGLAEVHVHCHAQVVVHAVAGAVHTAGQLSRLIQPVEDFIPLVEREEVADAVVSVCAGGGGSVVEDKVVFAALLTELGKVVAHVIVVVAVFVQLEQAGDVCVSFLKISVCRFK